jgi:hypothetical protein
MKLCNGFENKLLYLIILFTQNIISIHEEENIFENIDHDCYSCATYKIYNDNFC